MTGFCNFEDCDSIFRSSNLHIESAAIGDRGKVRRKNEDAFVADTRTAVFMVADGMGGHAAGEIASRMAVQTAMQCLAERNPDLDQKKQLHEAICRANARVYDTQKKTPEYHGMGSTLTVLTFDADRYYLGQVGDSRAYLLRNGRLRQLSRDHSLVWPFYENGTITKEEIAKHPHKHLLTRCIGMYPEVEVDLYDDAARENDVFMLCSDGLTDVLTDKVIQQILVKSGLIPEKACRDFIRAANDSGGPDNITAVVIALMAAGHPRSRFSSRLHSIFRTDHGTRKPPRIPRIAAD